MLGYRFDDKPGRDDVRARILHGYQVMVIEDRAAVADFIRDMAGSRTLYIRIRSLNAGCTTAEFDLAGSTAAIEAGFAACPLTASSADAAKRRSSQSGRSKPCHPRQNPTCGATASGVFPILCDGAARAAAPRAREFQSSSRPPMCFCA